jgi:uncharacterized protein YkwD
MIFKKKLNFKKIKKQLNIIFIFRTITQMPINIVSTTKLTDGLFNVCQKDFQAQSLIEHNNYRALHRSPALVSSSTLQQTAQKYAEYLANYDIFQHSGASNLGENLALIWSSSVTQLSTCSSINI